VKLKIVAERDTRKLGLQTKECVEFCVA
jgi:hypothetical protein